jgi:hypothetical protein
MFTDRPQGGGYSEIGGKPRCFLLLLLKHG